MTSETTGGSDGGQEAALPAIPGDVAEAVTGAAVYQDVTAPGERRPILPHWLQSRDSAKH